MGIVSARGVWKSFEELEVLRGVSIEIDRGSSVVIIGKSGCGKSVLLKLIMGLMTADDGVVMVDGAELSHLPYREAGVHRRRIGMLFQGSALFDSMNVLENVAFALREQGEMTEERIRAIVAAKLALVGLPGIEAKMPSELSGGMKRRVALARAIALDPEVMLYDEPTTGLDPVTADSINDLMIDLRKKLNVTSIAVTHDMYSASRIADRIAMLHDGKIIADGSPEEIARSDDGRVASFVSRGRGG